MHNTSLTSDVFRSILFYFFVFIIFYSKMEQLSQPHIYNIKYADSELNLKHIVLMTSSLTKMLNVGILLVME